MAQQIQALIAIYIFGALLLIFSIPIFGAIITAFTSRSLKQVLKFLFSSYVSWFACFVPIYIYISLTSAQKNICTNLNAKTTKVSPCSSLEQFFYVDLINWLVYIWIAAAFFICYFFFKKYGKRVIK